jgi:hypothetical protein
MSSLMVSRESDIVIAKAGYVRQVELEVELPGHALRRVALLIAERDAQLDHLEHVDITPHRLVVVVGPSLELPDRPRDNAGKLCVL